MIIHIKVEEIMNYLLKALFYPTLEKELESKACLDRGDNIPSEGLGMHLSRM